MCQVLNLLWEMTVLNVAFVSACFCGGHKDNFPFSLCSTDNFWSVSLKFGAYNITSKWWVQHKKYYFSFYTLYWHFFVIFHHKICVFIIFFSLFETYLSWTLTFYKKFFICLDEKWWKMLFISLQKLFSLSRYLNFYLDFLVM